MEVQHKHDTSTEQQVLEEGSILGIDLYWLAIVKEWGPRFLTCDVTG
jgi:hypothetical protein